MRCSSSQTPIAITSFASKVAPTLSAIRIANVRVEISDFWQAVG